MSKAKRILDKCKTMESVELQNKFRSLSELVLNILNGKINKSLDAIKDFLESKFPGAILISANLKPKRNISFIFSLDGVKYETKNKQMGRAGSIGTYPVE